MDEKSFLHALDSSNPPSEISILQKNVKGNNTCRKVLEISAAIFACSIVSITVAGLILHYPAVSNGFFMVFGIGGGLSALSVVICSYILCKDHQKPKVTAHQES